MNKQELIKKYKEYENGLFDIGARVACQLFLKDLEQLDEPGKVEVQQFLAEKIEYFKKTGDWDLFQAMDSLFEDKEIREWLEYKNNQETFARAWLDGYEVEEEKRYLVKVKGVSGYGRYLNKALSSNEYFFASNNEIKSYRTKFTRKELEEAGFGWVFSCEGVEVEEVE